MKVLLVDDHLMVNAGLASILEETGRFTVLGQAGSLARARELMEESASRDSDFFSLVILDMLLGKENGLDLLPFLEEFCKLKKIKKPPVLVCSVLEEPFRIQAALKLGAGGYISKTGSKAELLEAIDTVLEGKIYISNEHSVRVMKSYGLYAKFTKREFEILNLIKQNRTNKQIAQALGISVRTVENHVSNIYLKTGAENKQELLNV